MVVYNLGVRRAFATLLLVVMGFLPVALALTADSPARLPACCRKDGKHRCSMMGSMMGSTGHDDTPSGAAIKSAATKCPLFPKSGAVPSSAKAGAPQRECILPGVVADYVAAAEQAEAQYRISFSRAWQKRGPPSFRS